MKIKELTEEKEDLQTYLDICDSPVVSTFENGRYTDEIRELYINLLNMRVGRNNVGKIIETVLSSLTNVTLDGPLPSAATTSMLFIEAQTLANIQAGLALTKNINSTLHYDETSKYGRKKGSLQVTAGGRSYAVGLFDEDCGTAERLFHSMKECLENTAETLNKIKNSESELSKMLMNIKNTMTDRHSVNNNVDDLLEEWKAEIAKISIEGFENMSENDKKYFSSINRLRCSLHFLLGLAKAAESGLLEYDKFAREKPIKSNCRLISPSESSTTRTIKTVCKTFEEHGLEQAGVMAPFAVHLRNNPVINTVSWK